MSLSLDDYQRAIDAFTTDLRAVADELEAVYLFGSMARGEAIPGYSDLDFWLFLAEGVMTERRRWQRVLSTVTAASATLVQVGIPVYNACCYFEIERLAGLPAMLASNLTTDASRLLMGRDIRPALSASPASRALYRASAFADLRRQIYLPLAPYLQEEAWSAAARQQIFLALQYAKYLPEAACAALDLWPGERHALAALAAIWPAMRLDHLPGVKAFCARVGPDGAESELRAMLSAVLDVVESMHLALWSPQADG